MFAQLTLHATDPAATERFLETTLSAAGIDRNAWQELAVVAAAGPDDVTRNLHVGFAVGSHAAVDAFWRAGIAAGFADLGAPGVRPEYTSTYYGAFLADPDGNSLEAVHRDGMRTDGLVDHVWVRVDDPEAERDRYAAQAGELDLRLFRDTPERVTFVRDGPGGGTFTFVPGEPTRGLDWHLLPRPTP